MTPGPARRPGSRLVVTMQDNRAEFSDRLLRHQTQIFGYIYSLVRNLDDADDLFQQTSLALWKKFDQYDPTRSFLPWAFGVARFEVSNFLRSRCRDRLYFSDELNLLLIEAHEDLGLDRAEERLEALAGCIGKLRQRDQELLRACYGQSVRIPDVARDRGRSAQSIHNSLKRIRQCTLRVHPPVASCRRDWHERSNRRFPTIRDLIEAYCDGVISDADLRRLEASLLEDAQARRAFVEAFHLHTELHFAVRARRAADAALERVFAANSSYGRGFSIKHPGDRIGPAGSRWGLSGCGHRCLLCSDRRAVIAKYSGPCQVARDGGRQIPATHVPGGNIAWLVNAQDCHWAETEAEMPGRDMRAGKRLRLLRGLAEIEFDRGARVILQGPAGLELVSGSEARFSMAP